MKKLDTICLPIYLIVFQVAFIVLMAFFGRYQSTTDGSDVPKNYAMFMDVHSMMFLGFGFLMTFLKRYGFGSIGFNFLVAAYVLEWAILVRGWFEQGVDNNGKFEIGIENLLVADFCAAAVLISFGAVLGKATLTQLIVMATIEVVIQSINEHIGVHYLKGYDIGESMYVHAFGAYFGLAVAKILNHEEIETEKENSVYHSDLFSMIGTLVLWLYWPSFNSATAKDEGQIRAIVNTYLSITASCITTFIISVLVGKGKLNMIHVQNATLAGGVAIGAVADMAVQPFGAMIIGSLAGIISTLGYQYLTPLLKKIYLHDSCGVNNLHGIPGLISGFASGIAAAVASRSNYDENRLYVFYPSRIPKLGSDEYYLYNLNSTVYREGGLGRTAVEQGGYQIAALTVTFFMAIISGALTGLFLRLPIFTQIENKEDLFEDELNWFLPKDAIEQSSSSSVNSNNEEVHAQTNIRKDYHLNEKKTNSKK